MDVEEEKNETENNESVIPADPASEANGSAATVDTSVASAQVLAII